jgi:hypothetical protein
MATFRARCGLATSTRVVPAGAHLDESDPLVISNPQYFEPIRAEGAPVVEQATAAPGEVRTTPAKKAPRSAKKAAPK